MVGLLTLLSGVVWWQLPAVLNWGLTHYLQQQGLTNITVEISDVGVSQASIDQLTVSYLEPDTELRIELNQVRLGYTLRQLMSGNAEHLVIDSVILKLDHQPNPQVSTTPTLPTIDQLLETYSAIGPKNLPINTVQLPDISILHNLASESVTSFDAVELRADVTKLANQLTANVFFENQQALHWAISEDNAWEVQFFDTPVEPNHSQETEQHHPVFIGSLNQVDRSLEFSAEVKPGLAQRSPPSPEQTDSLIDLSEITLTGTIKSNSPAPGLVILSTAQVRDTEYQDYSIQTINGQFDVQLVQTSVKHDQSQASWKLNVKSDNTLSLVDARFADWQADNVALNVSGDVNLTEDVTKITSSDISLTVGKLQQAEEVEISDASFAGKVSATIDAEQWQIDLAESWQFTSGYGRLDEIELPQGLSISSAQPSHLKNDTAEGMADDILLENTSIEIAVPIVQDTALPLRARPSSASLQINQARFHQGQLFATGSLSIPELTIEDTSTESNQTNGWRLDNIRQPFELDKDLLTSRGSVDSTERDLRIETISKHDFKQEKGGTEFRVETIEFKDPQRLNQLMSPFVSPAKLVTGELALSGRAHWYRERDEWQTIVGIDTQLNNLGGEYDEAYFSGVNGQLSLQVYPEILTKKPQLLTVAHVDAGVVNTDTVIEFALRPSKQGDLPIVDLLQAQTRLLQGSISLKPTAYDLNHAQHNLQIVVENIDLEELVNLQQLDDVQATGILTGQLPVMLDNDQISIDNGQLHAIAPGGTLRYQANADALQSNNYAETVVLALQNFHYEVLRAQTQYKPDGTLLLELQLQGNNPDFEQGRPINLNINVEQNVLKLFESLRLIEGVSDRLDKRVQDFYQQTTSQ